MAETSRTTSHLSQIRKWWKHLSDENFVALDPPTSGRYTQSDLHEDATEEIHDRELPIETSYAGWHWQSHKRAFNKKGELLEPLIFHWGGDRETVREHLQNTPEGWTLSGGESDTRAFQLDLVAPRELPKFDDRNGTYRVLDRLTDRQREQPDDPIPADTEAWMHDLLAHVLNTPDFDSEIVEELLRNMSMAQLFTTEELDALTADTCTIAADTYVLEGLLHVQHPKSANTRAELANHQGGCYVTTPTRSHWESWPRWHPIATPFWTITLKFVHRSNTLTLSMLPCAQSTKCPATRGLPCVDA